MYKRVVILCLIVLQIGIVFGQNKKDIIEILEQRVDSLSIEFNKEQKHNFEKVSELDARVKSLTEIINQKELISTQLKADLLKTQTEKAMLQDELHSLVDSLNNLSAELIKIKTLIAEYEEEVEKVKKDSINSLIPEIKVNIYVRTDIYYDSEGWPVEMGKVVLVKNFQEKKEYQLNGYDYIEKIEIVGQSDDMTLQFINGKSNKIVHEEKAITLNGTMTYTTSDPAGEKHKYYQEWLNSKFDALIVKVSYNDKGIFEGKINPSKQ